MTPEQGPPKLSARTTLRLLPPPHIDLAPNYHSPPPSQITHLVTQLLSQDQFTSQLLDNSTNMEHCIGILIEPLVGLFTVCTEVFAICIDGCLQTCRESCRCISCCNNSSICNSRYDDEDDEEAQPILQQSQPTAQSQASVDGVKRWSSVGTLRDDSGRS